MKSILFNFIVCLLLTAPPLPAQVIFSGDGTRTREVSLLDEGWTFHRGDVKGDPSLPEYAPSGWEEVTLPHGRAAGKRHRTGTLWYRRCFDIDLTQNAVPGGRRIFFRFDAAACGAQVFINGHAVSLRSCVGDAWVCEATEAINGDGRGNIIAVRLDSGQGTSRRCPGTGLHGDVYLVETNRVHVPCGGQSVTAACEGGRTEVSVRTRICGVRNEELKVVTVITDPATGKHVASTNAFEVLSRTATEKGDTAITVLQHLTVEDPELSRQDTPPLYKADTDIFVWFSPKGPIPAESGAPPKIMHSDTVSTVFPVPALNR